MLFLFITYTSTYFWLYSYSPAFTWIQFWVLILLPLFFIVFFFLSLFFLFYLSSLQLQTYFISILYTSKPLFHILSTIYFYINILNIFIVHTPILYIPYPTVLLPILLFVARGSCWWAFFTHPYYLPFYTLLFSSLHINFLSSLQLQTNLLYIFLFFNNPPHVISQHLILTLIFPMTFLTWYSSCTTLLLFYPSPFLYYSIVLLQFFFAPSLILFYMFFLF